MREWDPRAATADEIRALLDTLNAVLINDVPDDPPWQDASVREYLAETMPGERRISWIAEEQPDLDGGSRILGYVSVLLLGDIGVLDVLVHPDARRRGLGSKLVAVAARRVWAEGFSSIGVEVAGGTPALGFFEARGLEWA